MCPIKINSTTVFVIGGLAIAVITAVLFLDHSDYNERERACLAQGGTLIEVKGKDGMVLQCAKLTIIETETNHANSREDH